MLGKVALKVDLWKRIWSSAAANPSTLAGLLAFKLLMNVPVSSAMELVPCILDCGCKRGVMKETLRRLLIALLWTVVAFVFVFVLFWYGDAFTSDRKAWICIIFGGGGWVVHKVINWIFQHKEIS